MTVEQGDTIQRTGHAGNAGSADHIGAITPAKDQAISAMVYACEKRGLRATSMDMRDALEAAMPFLCKS